MKLMKHLIGAAAAVVLVAHFAVGPAAADISQTKHNFSTAVSVAVGEDVQICAFCHVPHTASYITGDQPLWGRQNSAVDPYTLYAGTISGTVSQPGGVSKACLSCHDGSVTMAAATYDYTFTWTTAPDAPAVGGTAFNDLSDDHPIGMEIPVSAAYPVVATNAVGGLPLFSDTGTDEVECATCHDPHDDTNNKFLRVDNTNSGICTTCHLDK